MVAFKGTDNKRVVREQWDTPIIKGWAQRRGARLSYFGLPGPYIEDLRAWKEHVGHVTAVERLRPGRFRQEDLNNQSLLINNIYVYGLADRFCLLRGDIQDILIQGLDIDKRQPPMSVGSEPSSACLRYDLVNLDFYGGFGYRSADGIKRVRAMKSLLRRQSGYSNIVLICLSARDTITDELKEYLTATKRRVENADIRSAIDWYASAIPGRKIHLLKAVVPLFVAREAESQGFDCFCYPPLVYEGGERMIHFVFELTATNTQLHAVSRQSDGDILALPMVEAADGGIRVVHQACPNLDRPATASLAWPKPIEELFRGQPSE